MSKIVKNKYSSEAGDPFQLGGMDDTSGGMDMGMGGGMDMGMGGGFGGGFGSSPTSVGNGLKPQDSVMVRGMARLKKLLGVSFPKDLPKLKKDKQVNLFAYTPAELKYQPGFAQDPRYAGTQDSISNGANLTEYLNRAVQQSVIWDKESKSINLLTPEVGAAKDIMVASIMSPVDMQTSNVNVMVDGSNLSKEVEEKLTEVLSDYFNNDVKLGRRMSKWIGEALYRTGASPVLILPQSNIKTLNRMIDIDELQAGRDPSELIHGIKPTERSDQKKTISSGESLKIDFNSSFEALEIGTEGAPVYESFMDNLTTHCMLGLEKLDFISDKHKDHLITNRDNFRNGLKDVLANGRNWIRFSADPSVISKHKDNLQSKAEALMKDIDKRLVFNQTNPTYVVDMEVANDKDNSAPAIIELPYQSVIPIIVPGAPNQHIGYFIVVDQWGEPMATDTRDNISANDNSRVMEANMQAVFGTPSSLAFMNDLTGMQKFKTTSTIFGIMLRDFMQQRLEDYGLGGTQVEQHEAITSCIFRNLLEKKKIGLVFVPEPMMAYYRYFVHDDGTGKSLVEDIKAIAGLRTTLVTAGVMAATENSIDQKIIELNVDEKNANVQQMLEQVKNAFVEKRMMRYDNNPMNIQRELIQKSLTLVPKGIKGLQDGLSINTEHKSQGSVMPDDNLIKQLTDWEIMALMVPASAINKTNEDEFARTVVTTNMFFNNKVKILQQDTNDISTKVVRQYTKYSSLLQDRIYEVLKATEEDYEEYSNEAQELSKDQKEEAQKKAEKIRKSDTHEHKSDTKVEKNKKSPKQQLQDVLDHIFVKLPEPRIVVDKAQYEEITGFADCVDRVASTIYSEEMLPDDMGEYAGMLKVLRSRIKEKLVRDFIKNVGFKSIFDLPQLKDIDMDDSEELAMLLINYRKGLVNIKEQIGDKLNMTGQEQGGMGGFGGSDMSGGFGSSMGGSDFGSSGGMDMTGGGVDMNMGQSSDTTGTTPENNGETTQETNGNVGEMPTE